MKADWFDGLNTFIRFICHKSWLGGWLMPQNNSYFAFQLPKRWWLFGLDLALLGDIDVYQFKFFSELVKNKVSIFFLFCYINTSLKISQVDEIGVAPAILPDGMLTA